MGFKTNFGAVIGRGLSLRGLGGESITILGQHGPGVSDLIVPHLVDVGEMQKIVVDVLGHGSLPGLVVLPGGVDKGDDEVLVEKVAQVRPISLGTDDPSEFRDSL